jgi:TonB family protein
LNTRALLIAGGLLLAAAGVSAATRSIQKDVTVIEQRLEQSRQARATIRSVSAQWPRDVRGRRKSDDIEQWAYSPEMEQRVQEWLHQARQADTPAARAALAQARQALDTADAKALEIAAYWNRGSRINWQDRWRYFALTNQIPVAMTDPAVLAADQEMRRFLDAGDFVQALAASRRVEDAMQATMRNAALELIQAKKATTLRYVPRSTPCTGGGPPGDEARVIEAPPPDAFFPPDSRLSAEQGDVVITAHVMPSGCAAEFAVIVSSGYPRLDEAALRVADASRYAPASRDGQAIEGYVTFKVSFVVRR